MNFLASTISRIERRKSSYGFGEYVKTAMHSSGILGHLLLESLAVALVEVEVEVDPTSSDVDMVVLVTALLRASSISELDNPVATKNLLDPQRSGGGSTNLGDSNKIPPGLLT
ncbi:hypothetical protein QQP08_018312 [Theobroma cacao]|nr:hypothetical protein QQP08_018312 [Theobroma cacao]